jgi:vanillate O-demethylase ferredoxin subunit
MIEVVVKSRRLETQDIVALELANAVGLPLPEYAAGAHVDVALGEDLTRQYSLSRMPSADGCYEIGVLRDPQSRGGSVAVHQLTEGSALSISPPRNHFPLAPGPHFSLLFGGGIGVTPMLAMAEQLHNSGADFAFHYCARSQSSAAFLERLAAADYADRVTLHFDDGAAAQRLDALAVFRAASKDAHAYVCGPGGFMDYVLASGAQAGLPEASLHSEYFKAPDDEKAPPGASFQVRIASSGAVIEVGEADTIAKALRRSGISIEVSCEAGVCGACLTRVVEGIPDHRDYYLDDREKAKNDQIMVCCSRAHSPSLTLAI